VALSESALGCILTRNAQFFQWKLDKDRESVAVDCHPPSWLISAVATWRSWPGVRELRGIASCPFVRTDGSIPDPGYDVATGTLYRPTVTLKPIPDRPTQSDAREAAARLYDLVADFPFERSADRAVWLAGLLTAIQRPVIAGPVPGFAINGNKAGTGKGLLVDLIGLISGGFGIPTRSYPIDPVEAGKIKLSLALSGIAAVHFDNIPEGGFYGSSELDSAMTSTVVEGRILGESRESGPVPLRPCWFVTGNNISPSRDAFRRWVPCNLKTSLENPHERDDIEEKNLRQHVQEHQAELLHNCVVILKAHAIAGRPPCDGAPLGTFEEWDTIVRGAVKFARDVDCLTTQRKATAESPERAEKLALLEAWASLPEGGPDGAGITAAEARAYADETPGTPARYPALREALLTLSRDSKLPSIRQIGIKLRSMKGQNIGGWKFETAGEKAHAALWRVCKA
jgi:putative DNA primase/helicase